MLIDLEGASGEVVVRQLNRRLGDRRESDAQRAVVLHPVKESLALGVSVACVEHSHVMALLRQETSQGGVECADAAVNEETLEARSDDAHFLCIGGRCCGCNREGI